MGLVAHAQETNYDESEVGTYELPDALTTLNGQKVVNKEQWEELRRQEIIQLFEDNEYGIMPDATIKSSYRIVEESDNALGGKAIRRQVEITFSNNGQTRQMLVLLYMPKDVKKCPVFVSPNFQGNATTTADPYVIESQFSTNERANQTSRWSYDHIINSGYAVATFHYFDVYPDKEMGYMAASAAFETAGDNYRDGSHGAGCGATVGKMLGPDRCSKSGIGSYAVQLGDLKVGAIV